MMEERRELSWSLEKQLEQKNLEILMKQQHVEIDSSSLSSKSSTTTHSSFQDLKNAWQQVSECNSSKLGVGLKQLDQQKTNNNKSSSNNKMSRNNNNNNRRRHHHHTTKSTKSISSTRSYASQLYNQSNLSRDSESPYETTTASTTASGTLVQKHHHHRVHGSRRDKARLSKEKKNTSKGGSSSGGSKKKGDLAQRYNETSGSILHRHLNNNNNNKPSHCGGGGKKEDLNELDMQLTALSMGCDSNATPFVTNQIMANGGEEEGEGQEMSCYNMITTLQNEVTSLLMSNPSTVQSLCSKSHAQQCCELCCYANNNNNTHPTVRCTILTQEPKYISLEQISKLEGLRKNLLKEQKENDSVFQFSASQSPSKKYNSEKRLRNSTLTDGAVDNNDDDDNRSHVSSLTDHHAPPNFNTPLLQQGNNEDDLPGKTPPPELNAFLTSPTGMHWEDLVRSLKKKTGLEALIDKELIINLDEDDVSDMGDSREGNKYVGDMDCMGDVMKNYIKDKEDIGGDDDSSLGGFEDENDLSSIDDSNNSSHVPKEEEVAVRAEEGEGESSPPPREAATNNEPSPSASPRRVHSQRAKSLPRESLEKKIERVVTEQQARQEQEQTRRTGNNIKATTIIPLTPPPRSKSLTPRRRCQSISSGIGSAFSPIIKKNGNSNPNTPATTAMESTSFNSSYEVSSSAYSSSPSRRRGSSCGPFKFSPIVNFSPIELPHANSPKNSLHPVEPISPKAKRTTAVDVAPRVPSSSIVSKRRRAQRRESDPSDPPISINMSMSADGITTTTAGSRSNSAVADDDDDMKQPLLLGGTSDEVMDTTLLPVEVIDRVEQVDPPLMPIATPNEELDEEDSFYQRIRGENNSFDVLDVKLETDNVNNGNNKDDASTVVPFPTSWDADGDENDDSNAGSDTNIVGVSEQSKTVLLGWVDDHGNVVYGCEEDPTKSSANKDSGEVVNNTNLCDSNKNSSSTSATAPESITVGGSLNNKSNEVEVEDSISSSAVVAPPILCILPESLSANQKNPTCWQMTRHRLCRTKGEF